MPKHLALLRAVNVGGTGLLPMADLRTLAKGLDFTRVRTHLASGNLLLDSPLPVDAVPDRLTEALAQQQGRAVGVATRTADDLARLLHEQSFQGAAPRGSTERCVLRPVVTPQLRLKTTATRSPCAADCVKAVRGQ